MPGNYPAPSGKQVFMPQFTIRVELHGLIFNSEALYAKLHDEMAKIGFNRQVIFGGVAYELPHAEYIGAKNADAATVLDEAKAAAGKAHRGPAGIFVSAGCEWYMNGLKPAKA